MKAIQINKYGGIDVLEINENVPKPAPGNGQVLVEIHAASINPVDWKIREGYLKDMAPLQFPVTMGGDFAGVVTELGEGVTDFKTGDEVFGSALSLAGGSGAYADYATTGIKNITHKPKNLNFEEAASLPLVGSSAVQALEEHIKLSSGKKILIHGGAGGIGHIAIQVAKAHGAYVATTVSADDKDFVSALGADQAIDYHKENFEDLLKDYDAVFDCVGGETTNKSFQVLKRGGILVSMLGEPDKNLAEKYGVTGVGQFTQTNTAHLNRLRELAEAGKIKVNIDKVFPLNAAPEAFKHLEESHPRGKVVLIP